MWGSLLTTISQATSFLISDLTEEYSEYNFGPENHTEEETNPEFHQPNKDATPEKIHEYDDDAMDFNEEESQKEIQKIQFRYTSTSFISS